MPVNPARLGAILLALCAVPCSFEQAGGKAWAEERRIERLEFAGGNQKQTSNGTIRGYDTVEYRVNALAGQTMKVTFVANNRSARFNVEKAGSPSLYNSSNEGNDEVAFKVPSSGDHVVRVYLMRSAARRNARADYSLSVTLSAPHFVRQEKRPDNWHVANVPAGDRLNVRIAPNGNSRIIQRLDNGVSVQNLGCVRKNRTRWCNVATGQGKTGWAASRFLMQ